MPRPSENNPGGDFICPSARQAKLVKAFMEGNSIVDSARIAGYKQPEKRGHSAFRRRAVQKALHEAFEEAGLTVTDIARAHKELIAGRELRDDGTPRTSPMMAKDGSVVEITPPVDLSARAKGLDMLYKLRGEYESDSEERKGLVIRIQSNVKEIDISPEKKELNG